jgi:hypothetical protein
MPNQTQVQQNAPTQSPMVSDINSIVIAVPVAVLFSFIWNIYKSGKKQGIHDTELALMLKEVQSRLTQIESKIDSLIVLEAKVDVMNVTIDRQQTSIARLYAKLDEVLSNQSKIAMFLAKDGFNY